MLMSGERIESSLGVALGITTLAAAGLGNLISDVVGLGLADTIEVTYHARKLTDTNKDRLVTD
jgi:tRNA-specific adenosine deaminase 1